MCPRPITSLHAHQLRSFTPTRVHVTRRSSRRRKLLHGRSEVAISEALEGFCPELMRAGGGMLPGVAPLCKLLLERHGEAVGDHVFAEGPKVGVFAKVYV